jgi:hypothetical protein
MGPLAGTGETDQNQLTRSSQGQGHTKMDRVEVILSKLLFLSGNPCLGIGCRKVRKKDE